MRSSLFYFGPPFIVLSGTEKKYLTNSSLFYNFSIMAYQNQIKKRLKEVGRTQEWLSKMTGIRRDYLSKIINGHFKPNVYDALTISIALQSPTEHLFSAPGPKEKTNERTR